MTLSRMFLTIVKIRLTDYSRPFTVFTIVKKANKHSFAPETTVFKRS